MPSEILSNGSISIRQPTVKIQSERSYNDGVSMDPSRFKGSQFSHRNKVMPVSFVQQNRNSIDANSFTNNNDYRGDSRLSQADII